MRWERIHGRAQPPARARLLRAGAVEALLDGVDLRYVRTAGVEAVRRVYLAVRDPNWNTIAGRVSDLEVDESDDGFRVTFTCRHRRGELDFAWEGSIVGEPDGTIAYRLDGRAEGDFDYNRIGFCVLHPAEESRGAAYRAVTPAGPFAGRLPDEIEPQRVADGRFLSLFPALSRLDVDLPGGGRVAFDFEGALFEAEDQRNWIDASHKSYGPPYSPDIPFRATAGERVRQGVRISVTPPPGPSTQGDPSTLAVGAATGAKLGSIGLGSPTHDDRPSRRQLGLLRALAPAHLRADVRLAEPGHRAALRRVLDACAALGCDVELAIYLIEADADALTGVAEELGDVRPARILVFAADAASAGPRETTPGALVALVRDRLSPAGTPIGGGTDMAFCELNRTRPDTSSLDVVAWSANPQVHASDERSIMETPAALADTVRTARSFCGDRLLAVTPITLKPRFNAVATREEDEPAAGELPAPIDPRQASLFAAAWTVGTLARLAEAGVDSATYFEPIGWRGLLEREEGCPSPERFPSAPGMAFPVYHVLADLAGRRGHDVLCVRSGDELHLAGLALRSPDGVRVLAANLTAASSPARVTGLPDGPASVRVLDGTTAALAAADPESFRRGGERAAVAGGSLALDLGPYAVATIDVPTGAARHDDPSK